MTIDCSRWVALSLAETLRIPFASMSKVTSIWGTPRGAGGDVGQVEASEELVVLGSLALALEHVHGDRGLVVLGRREHLLGLGGNGGVLLDELRHHPAEGLDSERERGHVEQEDILDVPREHAPA